MQLNTREPPKGETTAVELEMLDDRIRKPSSRSNRFEVVDDRRPTVEAIYTVRAR